MKTTLNLLFTFAFIAAINSAFAAGNLKLNILLLNQQRAAVYISSLTNDMFSLSLTDERGNMVYYRENEGSGENYRKVFNFAELENGTYRLKVVCNDLSSERLIQKMNNSFVIGDEKTTIIPYFGFGSNILRCSYLNFNKETVTFHLYKNDNLLFDKSLGNEFSIQQALDLSKLNRGDYEAVLNAGEKQFIYNVKIR